MNMRVFASRAVASAFFMFTATHATFADIKPSKSAGLVLAVSKILVKNDSVIIQFVITNTTDYRIYLRDAQADASQTAFLSSGTHLSSPNSVVSIESNCGTVYNCLNMADATDTNSYSYVEPNASLPFSFRYGVPSRPQEDDTISFAVALIARFTKRDPDNAGPPKPVRFNFPNVPLSQ